MNIIQVISLTMVIIIFFSLFSYKGTVIKEGFSQNMFSCLPLCVNPCAELNGNTLYECGGCDRNNEYFKCRPGTDSFANDSMRQQEPVPIATTQPSAAFATVDQLKEIKEHISTLRNQINTPTTVNMDKLNTLEDRINTQTTVNMDKLNTLAKRIDIQNTNNHERFRIDHMKRGRKIDKLTAELKNQRSYIMNLQRQMDKILSPGSG